MAGNERAPGIGTFTASVNNAPFLVSKTVYFYTSNPDALVEGYDESDNQAIFSIPPFLHGDGPHTVEHYPSPFPWGVNIKGDEFKVKSGGFTFSYFDNRNGVEGEINFDLVDGRNVTGVFKIRR